MRIRTLVVDDQPMARERLLALLAAAGDIEVAGTCETGPEAVAFIRRERPDLVFLDMQMPGLDGLGVIEAIGPGHMPVTIFVTAYDDYAVDAFEAQALDYLLKPFARERFDRALERARRAIADARLAATASQMTQLVAELRRPATTGSRVLVRSGGRVSFVDVPAIDWVEAEGNYVRLHVGHESHVIRETMADVLTRLAPAGFARVHRSAIVNVARVRELRVAGGGDYDAVLASGALVPVSRSHRDALEARLLAGEP